MMKVLFVDDEILAMEYLQNLIPWEQYGFRVIGHAQNGKKAIELYEKERPELVISDISMAGMDGLQLTKRLKEINPECIIILLTAYKDFEYAKKGIEYGIFDYLVKHELSEELLFTEINKVKKKLEDGGKKQKIYQTYFARHLIYNSTDELEMEEKNLGNRFFLILVHKNNEFLHGVFHEKSWSLEELQNLNTAMEPTEDGIMYVADVRLTSDNIIILYKIENLSSKFDINLRIERMSRQIGMALSPIQECQFNLIYSEEIRKNEISATFQKMSGQIRYAVFWKPCYVYGLNRMIDFKEEEKISWNEKMEEIKMILYKGEHDTDSLIGYLFEMVVYPVYNMRALKDLIYAMENMTRDICYREGIELSHYTVYGNKIENIQQYYMEVYRGIKEQLQRKEDNKYSEQVRDMIRYIRNHYGNEISLESLGDQFHMNGVYLGQIFKKETGETFLKYLTNYRIQEAKRLLEDNKLSITEISELVGYRTSQYFSQIFIKSVGMRPQEYRRWNKRKQ